MQEVRRGHSWDRWSFVSSACAAGHTLQLSHLLVGTGNTSRDLGQRLCCACVVMLGVEQFISMGLLCWSWALHSRWGENSTCSCSPLPWWASPYLLQARILSHSASAPRDTPKTQQPLCTSYAHLGAPGFLKSLQMWPFFSFGELHCFRIMLQYFNLCT